MKRLVFSIFFLHFFPFFSVAQTPHDIENKYLSRMEPVVISVWDESVILHASLLLQPNDAFNAPGRKVAIEILIDSRGRVQSSNIISPSGLDAFDQTAMEAVLDLRLPPPPEDLVSDDGYVHVFWTFSRAAPFSSVKNAQIRYVRFTPEKAIERYLQEGMIQKAWKRLLETEQSGSFARASLEAFVKTFMLRFFAPHTLPANVEQAFLGLLDWERCPDALRAAYSEVIVDNQIFSNWVNRWAAEDPTKLCSVFAALEKTAPKRAEIVFAALLEPISFPCDLTEVNRAANSSWAPLQALAKVLTLRSASVINDVEIKELTQKTGAELLKSLDIIRLSRRSEFFDAVATLYASQTDPAVQAKVVRTLGALGHAQSMSKLLGALRSKVSPVRLAAVYAIMDYEAPDRIKRSKTAIWELDGLYKKDPEKEVRKMAGTAIVKLACLDLKNENNKNYFAMMLREKDPEILTSMVERISLDTELGRKKLLALLSHENAQVRFVSAQRLRKLPQDPAVREAFKSFWEAEDPRLHAMALFAAPGVSELLRDIEQKPYALRAQIAYEVAVRDAKRLVELLVRTPVTDDPRTLFDRIPYLLGLFANAR